MQMLAGKAVADSGGGPVHPAGFSCLTAIHKVLQASAAGCDCGSLVLQLCCLH
jgi:hypothetical protein